MGINEEENFIKIKDGQIKCAGFDEIWEYQEYTPAAPTPSSAPSELDTGEQEEEATEGPQGLTEAESSDLTTAAQEMEEIKDANITPDAATTTAAESLRALQPAEENDDEAKTSAAESVEEQSTVALTTPEEAVEDEEETLFDMSELQDKDAVEVTIIKHTAAEIVYGEVKEEATEEAEKRKKSSWTARQQMRCACSVRQDHKKAEFAHNHFKVIVLALDCDDVVKGQQRSLNSDAVSQAVIYLKTSVSPLIVHIRRLLASGGKSEV